MTSPRKLRSDINKLSSLSVKKPDYYFVHGFLTGVACAPELLPNSEWQKALFGEVSFESEDQLALLGSLIDFHNQIMLDAMDRKLKLPTQCKLSPSDIEGSVAVDAPLAQWCLGILRCFNLFDTESFDEPQIEALVFAEESFLTFSSYANLRATCRMYGEHWESMAMSFRRELTGEVDMLLGALRFGEIDELSPDFEDLLEAGMFGDGMIEDGMNDEPGLPDLSKLPNKDDMPNINDLMNMFEGEDDDIDYEYEDKLDQALYDDSVEAFALLHQLIDDFEKEKGPQYFKENEGHFWGIHETRSYMMLRQRRADRNYYDGKRKEAIADLQDMLKLNPLDNQALRFILASWLVIEQDWAGLSALLAAYPDEPSVPLLAANALMLFAEDPTSPDAKAAKKALLQANKHLVKYLTGQKKVKEPPEFYSPGKASEAEMYICEYGKQAWLSVEGSLFWLRKK